MLTIFNDPAGITGRQCFAWDFSASIQDNIARHLPTGGDCELLINGEKADPLTDPRMDAPPSIADAVTVLRRPEGFDPISWLYIGVGALVAGAVVYSMMPKIPGTQTAKDSPNNSLTGQANVARAYQAIPDVYGLRRVWPDLIQPSTVEYIDHVKYVTEWLCVSRGKGTISQVRYAETAIEDIAGASFEVFEPAGSGYPENGTTTLADVLETFSSDEVNGQELPYPTAFAVVTRTGSFAATSGATSFTVTVPDGAPLANLKSLAGTGNARVVFSYGAGPTVFDQVCAVSSFIVSGSDCTFTFGSTAWGSTESGSSIAFTITPNGSAPVTMGPYTLPVTGGRIRWNTVFLRGLKGTVSIKAEWWAIDSAGGEIGGSRQNQTNSYTADTFDQRYYTNEVTPSYGSGRYRVQFTRTNAQQNDQGADVAKLEELYAVRYYPSKTLPGVTVIRVTTKATNEATGFSDRKFNLRWARHVRTLTTDTLSASRNFARAMLHAWTIAGGAASQIDTAKLAAINAEFGEDSPLLRFDGSLDDADTSLGERLQLMANAARCVVWRDGLRWTVTRDQARPYVEMQFDYRNLSSSGESAISYAAHMPASNDGIELEYVDEASQSKKAYVYLDITSGAPVIGQSRNPKKIKLPGCATQSQAENRAQLEARRLIYQRVSVNDTALSDANALGLGALVRWIDPGDFAGDDGLQAGEVLAISGATITTSEPLDWKGQSSGRILFTGSDGKHLGAPIVCTPTTGGAVLASVPAGLYVADANRQLGSRYAFAVGLTQAEMEAAGLFVITEIKPDGAGNCSLSLASYDARIYGADA